MLGLGKVSWSGCLMIVIKICHGGHHVVMITRQLIMMVNNYDDVYSKLLGWTWQRWCKKFKITNRWKIAYWLELNLLRLGETSVAGWDRNEDCGGLGRHILEEYSVLVQSQGDHEDENEDDLDDDGDNDEDNGAWDGTSWRSIPSLSRAKVIMMIVMTIMKIYSVKYFPFRLNTAAQLPRFLGPEGSW